MTQPTEVRDLAIGNWILSVTTRDMGDDPKILEELTYRTIMTWINIVRRLEQQNYAFDGGSVEQVLSAEIATSNGQPFEFSPPVNGYQSRVTVWSTYRGGTNPNFHLNSDDTPQVAIDVWRANQLGSERAVTKFNTLFPNAPQTAHNAPNPGSNAPQGTNTPPPPANPSDGVIVATLGPSLKKPQYAHGQLVSYTVTQIDASSEHGSPTFKLTITVGKYPITIFKLDSKGQPKKEFELVAPVLNGLGLDFNKPSAKGTWRLVCKANHVDKDGATLEYMNCVSLEPI